MPILDRIAAGDQDAAEECIARYGGLVWSLARRMTPNAGDAEDGVQEIFIELWKNAGRFDPERASEATFIAMIARRRLIDRRRRASRQPEVDPLPDRGAQPASDDHLAIERSAEASLARRVLRELRPEQRRVVEMSIHLGMSHSEIATETGLPTGTVKSHIWRGLAQVRKVLRPATAGSAREATS